MQFVFDNFVSSLLTYYVLVFCFKLWQPAVFYNVLVLYLRTQIILKPTYIKDCKHYCRTYCCFGNQFSALSHYIGSTYKEKKYLWKGIVLNRWGGKLLCAFCVSTCLHYLNSFSTSAAHWWSSLHFRRH